MKIEPVEGYSNLWRASQNGSWIVASDRMGAIKALMHKINLFNRKAHIQRLQTLVAHWKQGECGGVHPYEDTAQMLREYELDIRMDEQKNHREKMKEIQGAMLYLLELAEAHYPRYSTSDNIAECEDLYKRLFD